MNANLTAEAIDVSRACPRFLAEVPIHFARRHAVLGLVGVRDGCCDVLADSTSRQGVVDNLALTLRMETRLIVAAREAILQAIDAAYQRCDQRTAEVAYEIAAPREGDVEQMDHGDDLLDNATRAPVIRLVNLMLFDAAQRGGSDVHVQPLEGETMVRLRIDGVLRDYLRPARSLQEEIIARIKVMGAMDIAEKRLPQDGRATVRIGDRLIDLRISTIPTAHGERAVLRLLDKGARLYDLPELGMAPAMLATFAGLLNRSHGMVLMTGPTGSGKSTTLYAGLQHVNYQQLNVVTLEDPIEYHLPGISQTQISDRKGMTFAAGLRSLLRQDPDVIMIGEIRDEPTARLAIQAALTGHLVISTLHTNDAPGAVSRLVDLGIEPYLIADSLLAAGAQRLVRLTCRHCAETRSVTAADAARLGISGAATYQHGHGCDACGGIGYHGRRAIFQLMIVDDAVRALIHARASLMDLAQAATKVGLTTLRHEGAQLIQAGWTTPAEVLRVTQVASNEEQC
ncbi:MAG: Flp pilus assembly complex ATPase component TadA [Phycisphaerales bacterium]|nr:Flp pilus assembly complex ATPase component TadA [Phycisphaerales bacterium]